jgi:hypothetical protein
VDRKARLPEVVPEPLDGRGKLACDPLEEVRDVDRNLVTVRNRRRIALVPVEQRYDTLNLAELPEQVVQPLDIDGVDNPDIAVDGQRVTRALHRLPGMGNPAHAAVEAVNLLPVGRLAGTFHWHIRSRTARDKKGEA